MQFIKALLWLLTGVGLTLTISSDNQMVRQAGACLLVIALLWRLLLYLRETPTAWERLDALGSPKLSILDPLAGLEAAQPNRMSEPQLASGRTPVQKLLDDDTGA